MRRNRKKRTDGFIFPAPLAVAIAALSAFGVSFGCLRARTDALGREIKQLEARRNTAREMALKEENRWAQARSPAGIEEALNRHGLTMTWPAAEQVVRLADDSGRETPARPRYAASRLSRSERMRVE